MGVIFCCCYFFAVKYRNCILASKMVVKLNYFITRITLRAPFNRKREILDILSGPHQTVSQQVLVPLTLQNVPNDYYRALLLSLYVSVRPTEL